MINFDDGMIGKVVTVHGTLIQFHSHMYVACNETDYWDRSVYTQPPDSLRDCILLDYPNLKHAREFYYGHYFGCYICPFGPATATGILKRSSHGSELWRLHPLESLRVSKRTFKNRNVPVESLEVIDVDLKRVDDDVVFWRHEDL